MNIRTLVLVAGLTSCAACGAEDLTGTWVHETTCPVGLTFSADGRYESTRTCAYPSGETTLEITLGRYAQLVGEISLTPEEWSCSGLFERPGPRTMAYRQDGARLVLSAPGGQIAYKRGAVAEYTLVGCYTAAGFRPNGVGPE